MNTNIYKDKKTIFILKILSRIIIITEKKKQDLNEIYKNMDNIVTLSRYYENNIDSMQNIIRNVLSVDTNTIEYDIMLHNLEQIFDKDNFDILKKKLNIMINANKDNL
tara:strand:+ start:3270 stop:3593 length:324 start_codon:yes stop_codon:yes gene_type:complete